MRLLGRGGECEFLDAALADALAGRSRAVVLRGEAGAGKSALLEFVVERADRWHVATAVGIESEMELAYSGLHQLCGPMIGHLDGLPIPQRNALATVFGQEIGPPPDRFLVALAALTLLAEVAEQQPLLCVIDDAQWLDSASAQILLFVGRRLLAERIALVCAARNEVEREILVGLPELSIPGLAESDARALLLENVQGPFDAAVCEQIVRESRGNPLALLELPRTWKIADMAGGFGLPAHHPVVGKIEQSYSKRLLRLPADAQLLALAAAAEPLGDPILLERTVTSLGVDMAAAVPAVEAGLLQIEGRVEFAHPLVRSAAYGSATREERQRVHQALAEATDAERDADRRAWHRARGAPRADEEIAGELERSAGRAQSRGGVAAAAAFLELSAALSPEPAARARRSLAAAEAKQLAGSPQAASKLLLAAVDGPLDARESALAQRLKGLIALDLRRIGEVVPLLLDAADRLQSIEPDVACEAYVEALRAGCVGGRLAGDMLRTAAQAARNAPSPKAPPHASDLMLAGLAIRFTEGYAAGAPLLQQALTAFHDEDPRTEQDSRWPGYARAVALELFDDASAHALCTRSVQLARERGALGVLPLALNYLAITRSLEGDLDTAESLMEESDAITEATGGVRIAIGRFALVGLRGDARAVSALVEVTEAVAIARREGALLTKSEYALALLYNGLGRYEAALDPAERASGRDGETFSNYALAELVEAAARSGRSETAVAAVERLSERTQAAGTEWALGVEARSRGLLSDGALAEGFYSEAIERLTRCRVAPDLARGHLVYGEWLRREGRRIDARAQLRIAFDMLDGFGMHAFAERARRELTASGETVRKRSPETIDDLTPQEAQIAQLARDGYSNPEIGTQLFLSSRTIEWHMGKVFAKLGIGSRRELDTALALKP